MKNILEYKHFSGHGPLTFHSSDFILFVEYQLDIKFCIKNVSSIKYSRNWKAHHWSHNSAFEGQKWKLKIWAGMFGNFHRFPFSQQFNWMQPNPTTGSLIYRQETINWGSLYPPLLRVLIRITFMHSRRFQLH